MKIPAICLITAALLISIPSGRTYAEVLIGDPMVQKTELFIQRSDDQAIEVDYVLPGVVTKKIASNGEIFDLIQMDGEGMSGAVGAPELPVIRRFFAVPDDKRIKIRSVIPEYRTYQSVSPFPHQEYEYETLTNIDNLTIDESIYGKDAFYPEKWVTLSKPAIMRDLRIVPVNINPVQVNTKTGEVRILTGLHLEIEFDNGPTDNVKTKHFEKSVPSYNNLYKNIVSNYDWINPNGVEVKGSLLIVYPNVGSILTTLQPLIDWKTRLGYKTTAVGVANNTTTNTVQSIIQSAYDSFDPPLEHVMLIGDASGIYDIPCYFDFGGSSDHHYTQLEGGDIFADVSLGRISVDNITSLTTAISKILYYESNPIMSQTDWYKKGAVVAGSSSSGISTIHVGRSIRDWWLEDGHTQVDTMWYNSGSIFSFIVNTLNSGISSFSYRGFQGTNNFDAPDVMDLTNVFKLPFAVMITCSSGDFGSESDIAVSEAWLRAGTPFSPSGGIGGVGTATGATHTRFNNTMIAGIWFGLHAEGISQLGPMTFRGKYEMLMTYEYGGGVIDFVYWNNLMGDPTTDLWSDIPQILTVAHPDEIAVGSSSFTVHVEDDGSNPLENRYVTLWKGDETYLGGRTDENGDFSAAIDVPTEGELLVTVTYHNDLPYLNRADVVEYDVYLSFLSYTIDDDNSGSSSGNNDGIANPGETIELGIELKNFGSSSIATLIDATLSTNFVNVNVITPNVSFPNLSAGFTGSGLEDYIIEIGPDIDDGYVIPFTLDIHAAQGDYISAFDMSVGSADLEITNSVFSAGTFEPGETTDLTLTLLNSGSFDLTGLSAVMTTDDPQVTIEDNLGGFGNIAGGSSGTNSGNVFTVSADECAADGKMVEYYLHLTSTNGFEHDLVGNLTIGVISENDPFGPDSYGYYCIDNTDVTYDNHPTYEYFDISVIGTRLNLPDYENELDASVAVTLPFDFTFYGETSDILTVCSNGWLAIGDESYHHDFRNYPIPSALGASDGMICPYWDDIIMGSGYVYSYNDEANHRFVVEYHNVDLYQWGHQIHTFEVFLYDPAYVTTPTGDSEIVFQYQTVNPWAGVVSDNEYFTTGIENHEHSDGLEYAYWNVYHPAAAPLVSGRAIKFTTYIPEKLFPPAINHPPAENITEPVISYPVYVNIDSYYPINPDSILVYWSLTPGGTFNPVNMIPDTTGSGHQYLGMIPESPPGNIVYYYFYAVDIAGAYSYYPELAPNLNLSFMVGPVNEILVEDAEVENGWTYGVPGDQATLGIWIREDPVLSVADNTHIVQPEDDHTVDPGHICFVTGNADPGAAAGTNDVDGGETTLLSPVYDLTDVFNPMISYWYWYSNNQGINPGEDFWDVDVSNNGGNSWVSVVHTSQSTPEDWANKVFWLNDYVTSTSNVQFRFIADDSGNPALVEACVDDIKITELGSQWPDGFVPASNIHIDIDETTITLNWIADPWGVNYIIVKSDDPYFTFEEGAEVGQTTDTTITFNRITDSEFYMIKAER